MRFKPACLIPALMFFLIIIMTGYAGAEEQNLSPKAGIEQAIFEFSPVIAGTEVTHRFSISNTGNTPLNIPGVYVA